ncbi:MAG: poly(R)-hydroxyalkanoic acid synthase subunit PhaE [Candidatus Competibacteraceae bacterium]
MSEKTTTSDNNTFDIELLLAQARTFLAFGDQMRQFTEQLQTNTSNEPDWNTALQQHFATLKEAIARSASDPNVDPNLAKLWTQTLDTWQQTATMLGLSPNAGPRDGDQAEAWQTYQQIQNEYLGLLQQTAKDALDLMEARLKTTTAAGQPVNSLRELYDLWVDCNEETYGQMLRSPHYSEFSGRLLNTLLRCCYPHGDATS